MPERQSPTLRRRRLAREMRRYREAAGLSLSDAAAAAGEGHTEFKVGYLEREAKRINPRDISDLLAAYGVTDENVIKELVMLARDAKHRGWWFEHRGALDDPYRIYIDFEAEAASVLNFEPLVVPGLVQTPEYARALSLGGPVEISAKMIDERVEVRTKRQAALFRDENPLRLRLVIDEAVISRIVGGRDVMCAQLRYMQEVADLPTVALQIIPFTGGPHAGTHGGFAILEFPEPLDLDVVYVESLVRDTFFEEAADVREYHRTFQKLTADAASPSDSIQMIAEAVADL